MAETDVDRTRAAWEAFAALEPGDLRSELAEHFWAEDLVYIEDPVWPGAATIRGRGAVIARFDEYTEVLGDEPEIQVETVRAGNAGLVVSIIVFRAKSTGSGAPWEHRWGYVTRMRDGRLVEWRAYHDPDEALAAAELGQLLNPGE